FDRWQEELRSGPGRDLPMTTISGRPVAPLYTPDDLEGFDAATELGYPGQFPYTRGIHASMYRGRHWTMRQVADFGTPRQTNSRFRTMYEKVHVGLITNIDLPTLMELDSDDPRSAGEVGRLGVAVDSIEDIRQLYDGVDLEQVSVSMTINAP